MSCCADGLNDQIGQQDPPEVQEVRVRRILAPRSDDRKRILNAADPRARALPSAHLLAFENVRSKLSGDDGIFGPLNPFNSRTVHLFFFTVGWGGGPSSYEIPSP